MTKITGKRPGAVYFLRPLGALMALIGLALTAGGGYLATLGGSRYFLFMGLMLMVAAGLLIGLQPAGAWIYALAFLLTLCWAIWDAGLSFWPLFSRLFMFGVLALLVTLAYPPLKARQGDLGPHRACYGLAALLALCLAASLGYTLVPTPIVSPRQAVPVYPVPPGAEQKNWLHWGNTTAGDRFAALDQITKANVAQLQVAWVAHTGDIPLSDGAGAEDQNTPLQVGDTLYVCTAYGKVLALAADSGKTRWRFDPLASAPNWQRCRGVGYYADAAAQAAPAASPATASSVAVAPTPPTSAKGNRQPPIAPDAVAATPQPKGNSQPPRAVTAPIAPDAMAPTPLPKGNRQAPGAIAAPIAPDAVATTTGQSRPGAAPAVCARRLFLPTNDARLIALDAETGRPCADFGDGGTVDLTIGMGEIKPGYYQQTSAPLVAGDRVVVGGRVADNFATGEPPGVVRAFDVHSGALVWAWDPGNPAITRAPPPGSTYTRGTPNVWAAMSFDSKLNLIYLPTGNATPDFFGGGRSALDDKYSSSVVAVDASTGRVRWHFQTTHHDLWDFDLPAQPLLYDLPDGSGGTTPVLVQTSKQGMIFMLNRVTGEPVAKVEERAVPVGDTPGERYSPTQPFSVGMANIGNQTLTEADMWGATPLDQLLCRIAFKGLRHQGVYTPPGRDRALQFPGSLGGMNWGSVALDPHNALIFVNDMRLGLANSLVERAKVPQGASGIEMGLVPQEGTPYGAVRERFLSPLGIPCQKPPFGTLSAVDLTDGKLVWQVPLGTVQDTGPLGIKMHLPMAVGMPTLGPSLVTQSGLLFFAGTQDYYLRAFDTATGKVVWRARLPVGSQAGPITYVSPTTGRQYIVISAGGARQSPDRGDYVIAYALPDNP